MGSRRAYASELIGTLFLVMAVVGSGVMGESLAGGNVAVALLVNAIATGAVLYVLILGLGPISGAHFNPVVTLIEAAFRRLPRHRVPGYIAAQIGGGLAGVILAHAMFGLPLIERGTHARASHGEVGAEVIATFGLWLVIALVSRARPRATAGAVALYIVAAYWFTASTSFANPAVTIARALTDTFAGIRPADVPAFIAAQLVGGGLAAVSAAWLVPQDSQP